MTHPIHRRALLAASLTLAAAPKAWAAGAGLVRVVLKTTKGAITVDLEAARAPITTRNFLRYVDLGRFDGSAFYRAARVAGAPQLGVVEGGLREDPAKLLRPIPHESTLMTGLSHKDGTISMARHAPGTATADFFICVGDQPSFDADAPTHDAQGGYAAFGQVVEGMELVRAILAMPTSPYARIAEMKGQMLDPPVPILTARRAARAA
jgi:peptidyl-prolyl cis-trans isomerase A (cyclophilin A)